MIEIERLVKRYGNFAAVDDVSLTARPGEIFGFLGPNGAGKTTTIRILAGLSLPSSGRVRVGGIDVVERPTEAKAITGYVPDRPFLYEKLTGREMLRFVADLYRRPWSECEARSRDLLELLALEGWEDARIESYSHGMKQKLVLISALLHDPAVLVIDEPMVGLDALAQKQVRRLLRAEADRGKTVFLTTHTLSVAEAVCDAIAIIHRGKIAAEGPTREVVARGGREGSDLEDAFLAITYGED
ncbi:MAG TPA: ABC transporter ATP-binding protein [Thermoanaerobaculia bacterium]|nr:ABC transporter ATP-binding protein [Thermoanaerobaculia bacterium]